MQFDIRMEAATMYKKGLVHNSKQEQLVTIAVASQQIADASVTFPSVSYWCSMRYVAKPSQIGGSCSCHLGMLHYPCKHMMRAVSLSSSKSGTEFIRALSTWHCNRWLEATEE